jgi:hypothetical protein
MRVLMIPAWSTKRMAPPSAMYSDPVLSNAIPGKKKKSFLKPTNQNPSNRQTSFPSTALKISAVTFRKDHGRSCRSNIFPTAEDASSRYTLHSITDRGHKVVVYVSRNIQGRHSDDFQHLRQGDIKLTVDRIDGDEIFLQRGWRTA